MIIIGADPGLSGALSRYDTALGVLAVEDMPVLALKRGGKAKNELDAHALARVVATWLEYSRVDHAFVEQVGAMPGQGVSSVFSFGRSAGILYGVLAALQIPVTFVPPATWKKALKVPAAKDGARARASQILPRFADLWGRCKDDGRAEASLIAYWGAQQMANAGRAA